MLRSLKPLRAVVVVAERHTAQTVSIYTIDLYIDCFVKRETAVVVWCNITRGCICLNEQLFSLSLSMLLCRYFVLAERERLYTHFFYFRLLLLLIFPPSGQSGGGKGDNHFNRVGLFKTKMIKRGKKKRIWFDWNLHKDEFIHRQPFSSSSSLSCRL